MNKSIFSFVILSSLFILACTSPKNQVSSTVSKNKAKPIKVKNPDELASATLGAGCFWCVEAVFEELRGVVSVESGYSGGEVENPSYKAITTGETGHAEVAKIVYDPSELDFETILEVFWTTHDPTTLNRQGYDVGTQYRSVIFYHDETQKSIAERSKKEVAPTLWDDPIVTEISPLINYYKAEEYHQDYYELNPNYGYCVAVINPKMEKFRKRFADKLKGATLAKAEADQGGFPPVLKEGNYNSLNDKETYVIQEKGTEYAFSGAYHDHKESGTYICRQCNLPLFKSSAKFKSGTGWPSFDDIYAEGNVKELTDADGRRTEIVCGNCGGHLGHVFRGEGFTDKQTRHCVNSVSLDFVKE